MPKNPKDVKIKTENLRSRRSFGSFRSTETNVSLQQKKKKKKKRKKKTKQERYVINAYLVLHCETQSKLTGHAYCFVSVA